MDWYQIKMKMQLMMVIYFTYQSTLINFMVTLFITCKWKFLSTTRFTCICHDFRILKAPFLFNSIFDQNQLKKKKDQIIYNLFLMDTSSSIRHRFDVENPRGRFAEIISILKGEFMWKLWHRFDVEILMWIPLSKSTKYRWILHVSFSKSFQRRIDVISVLAIFIV